ncbi:MAG TPA: energy-coupling factor ABC transporter permease [Steroidobacteraceae bacterium]|nr:energy-coupling factor ABC transporter permease [Steroidobacteraceae bacterium]
MLIEAGLLTAGTTLATGVVSTTVVLAAVLTAPWRAWLEDRERQVVWLTYAGFLVLLWSMHAGITPGLSVRFLMMTAFTLMNGWQLAVIGAGLALAVLTLTGHAAWGSYGANLLCMAVVPALFAARWHEFVHARLPHNYFIYFFLGVFLGAALAFNAAGLVRLAVLATSGALDTSRVGAEYLAILPFMSFGEGAANGMLMAMAVVYRPRWVMSFDDRLYLRRRD